MNTRKTVEKFLLWLYECTQRDYEDIHYIQFTTEECKELYIAIQGGAVEDDQNNS